MPFVWTGWNCPRGPTAVREGFWPLSHVGCVLCGTSFPMSSSFRVTVTALSRRPRNGFSSIRSPVAMGSCLAVPLFWSPMMTFLSDHR